MATYLPDGDFVKARDVSEGRYNLKQAIAGGEADGAFHHDRLTALDDPIRSTRPDEEIDRGRVAEMRRSRRQSIEQSAAEHLPQGMFRYECCLLTGRAKYGKL